MDLRIRKLGGTESRAPKTPGSEAEELPDAPVQPQQEFKNNSHKIQSFLFTCQGDDGETDQLSIEELKSHFTEDFSPIKPGPFYIFGLGILTVFMISMMIVYFGITGYLGAFGADHLMRFFQGSGGALSAIIGFGAIGLIFLMIKPFLLKQTQMQFIDLDPKEEPLIYYSDLEFWYFL